MLPALSVERASFRPLLLWPVAAPDDVVVTVDDDELELELELDEDDMTYTARQVHKRYAVPQSLTETNKLRRAQLFSDAHSNAQPLRMS